MANEYITRYDVLVFMEAQREQIKKQMDEALAYEHFHTRSDLKCALSQLEDDIFLIESIRATDVRPVRHGKWTLNKNGSGTCSECGRVQTSCWDLDGWDNFCHHCGADMREADDG